MLVALSSVAVALASITAPLVVAPLVIAAAIPVGRRVPKRRGGPGQPAVDAA